MVCLLSYKSPFKTSNGSTVSNKLETKTTSSVKMQIHTGWAKDIVYPVCCSYLPEDNV